MTRNGESASGQRAFFLVVQDSSAARVMLKTYRHPLLLLEADVAVVFAGVVAVEVVEVVEVGGKDETVTHRDSASGDANRNK